MKHLLLGAVVLAGLAGCSSKPRGVVVFAAASTEEALTQIARDFEAKQGTHVECSFAASSALARQIGGGAGADVFVSADENWADYLSDKHLVVRRRDLLGNRLVVVTPADRPLKLAALADVAGDEVKHLAVGNEPVPAGRYTREALRKAGVWDKVKGRLREGGDVRAVLALVARGEAEAGVVYATDAAASDRVKVALPVPEELHAPIRYPVVLLGRGDSQAARAFYDFLGGAKAQEVFRKAGFQVVGENEK
jgi:molybdate transport system substrate-binding protein